MAILPTVQASLRRHPRLKAYLILATILTCYGVIGCVILRETTEGTARGALLLARQIRSLLLSLLAAGAVFALPRRHLKPLSILGGLLTYLSLWGLFLFGVRLNGSYAWYRFGTFCLQPAEIIKPFFIVTLSWLCIWSRNLRNKRLRLPVQLAYMGLLLLPIILQPDLGTALVLALTFFLVTWCDGMPVRQLLMLAALGAAVAGTAYVKFPHLQRRLDTYAQNVMTPSETHGYHAQKLQECLIKGGWTGNLMQSQDALNPLPYRYSDSLFAGTVELIGALGAIPIVILCLAWFFHAYKLALDTQDDGLRLIYLGTGIILTTQAFLHIAVNLGLVPNTGIPLPLLSYGGSSLLSTFLMVALAQRLHVEDTRKTRQSEQADTGDREQPLDPGAPERRNLNA